MNQKGQLLIVIAIIISVVMLLLGIAVDAGRLFIERAQLRRIAQSAADAGIGVAAEKMVELAQMRKDEAGGGGDCTPSPQCWLEPEDWDALGEELVREGVEAEALDFAGRNGIARADPKVLSLQIEYRVLQDEQALQVEVGIRQRSTILLVGLLGQRFVVLEERALSIISPAPPEEGS